MITQEQRRRLERERNSLEKLYKLQSEKVAWIREALIIETDPLRKFQYEHQIQEDECTLKELDDKLSEIENQL
ncbi:MAG: hypothetical protein F6K28_07280 [Microcoleus sp. SIO2G3]|nr:hypothetical protein [Microcoleus sp. SIO2G3]